MQRFCNLEKVIGRAPLGIRFLDLVGGVSVNDGLVVTAWPAGLTTATASRLTAIRSPLSGIYGFPIFPRLRRFEGGEAPASDWCGSPPTGSPPEPNAPELTAPKTIRRPA